MNIDQLSISDIVIIVHDLFYAIQRMWPFFRYILTEDEIAQRYARKQRTLINYAIRICEKWMYDAQLNRLMGQTRTKEIKCGQDAKKIRVINYSSSKEDGIIFENSSSNENQCLIVISGTEAQTFSVETALYDFWRVNMPEIITSCAAATVVGFSMIKFMFTADDRYRQHPIQRILLPLTRCFRLLYALLRIRRTNAK
ncbi:unnamed protein product [Didymodactylos carnosus]|uniref:Uncharacterized protein n=1 Tax=Didymodactylos carnosus TaxID=1234261 RepID=A0A816ALI2_9BILA|nr:unnamed protein product [Didymodactylos carnosus]CAF4473507.1 unnamed protein product [Didymodactylos carnosus]